MLLLKESSFKDDTRTSSTFDGNSSSLTALVTSTSFTPKGSSLKSPTLPQLCNHLNKGTCHFGDRCNYIYDHQNRVGLSSTRNQSRSTPSSHTGVWNTAGIQHRAFAPYVSSCRPSYNSTVGPTAFYIGPVHYSSQPYPLVHQPTQQAQFLQPQFAHQLGILGPPPSHATTLPNHLGKFDDGFFVRYSLNSKAFRVYNIRTRKVEENLHIRFLENKLIIVSDGPKWLFNIYALTKSMNYVPVVTGTNSNDFEGTKESIGTCHASKETRSSINYILLPLWKDGLLFDSPLKNANNDEPQPFSDAEKKNDDGVWTLVDLPYGKRAIGTKWIYKNKKDKRGIMVRNEERLVAQGHTQEKGIDYDEVFAPVARIEEIRLFLAYASFKDFVVYQMDVKSEILYGKIEEEVYVCQPLGFEDPEKELCIEFEKMMHKKFQMSSMGELTFFLGLQTANTPMETSKSPLKDAEAEDVDVHLYRSMIGSLMYLTSSRPDIMFAVYACARFQVTPKVLHLHAMKKIFKYLKSQPKLGLWYPMDSPFDLETYTDIDYAGVSLDRKSTTREYVAAASCCGQVLWI
nr:hypothetical protein [Tanacetum cinerariifolium]